MSPPGQRNDERGQVVVAAHVFCESQYALGRVLRRGRAAREVADLVVRDDGRDAVGDESDVGVRGACAPANCVSRL